MAYNHGITVSEVATSILPSVDISAGIPFIVGTAPVNMTDPTNVNKPTLCYSYAEAVAAFGFVPAAYDEESQLNKYEYTLSEFIYSQFSLFQASPAVIVNVLDPTKHKKSADVESITLDARTGAATIDETGIIADSIEFGSYTQGEDYLVTYDENGKCVISSLEDEDGNFKCTTGEELSISAEKLDPSQVTVEDIIGGVDTEGNSRGMELIEEVYPRFRVVPGVVIAPGYSQSPSLAAVMAAKCASINELFKAICVCDIPTDTVKQYSACTEWKNNNNYVDSLQVVTWPCIQLDGTMYHLSTQAAGLIAKVDGQYSDVPYVSPSNKNLQMTGMCLEDGTEIVMQPQNGTYLNSQGIVTALNFQGGWKLWGNRTACYPDNTDVKDAFICIRRMFNWVGNTLILNYWSELDNPLNRRQVQTLVDSANMWLNGLASNQQILGGRVEFLESENTTVDLMDGIAKFHVYITPPSPNREIDFIMEYDPSYIETLFG